MTFAYDRGGTCYWPYQETALGPWKKKTPDTPTVRLHRMASLGIVLHHDIIQNIEDDVCYTFNAALAACILMTGHHAPRHRLSVSSTQMPHHVRLRLCHVLQPQVKRQ